MNVIIINIVEKEFEMANTAVIKLFITKNKEIQELTNYLAAKSCHILKKFYVTADTRSENNKGHPIIEHNNKEADTIIVLHVASIPPNYSLYVD
jgi:hypothetical protein